jgi:hypothetical protein
VKKRIFATAILASAAAVGVRANAQTMEVARHVPQSAHAAANGHSVGAYATPYAATTGNDVGDDRYVNNQQTYSIPNAPEAQVEPGASAVRAVDDLTYTGALAQPATETDGGGIACAADSCTTTCCPRYCDPFWAHRTGLFGEALFLKPRGGSDVASAIPQNGIGPGAVPAGKVGSNSPTYSPGFRVGGTLRLDRVSSLYAAYTYYQAESNGSTFANPPLVVHSLVTLPQTGTAASDGLAAFSRYNIRFQFADADYRRLIAGGGNWFVNYAVGARYANLQQLFRQAQVNGPGMTGVTSNIGMDAAGGRVGLMGARKGVNCGFFFYGNAFADILVGNFRGSYLQANNLAGVQGANTWQSFRPVPILEYELGAGWVSPNGAWRFSAGYYYAAWFNAVTSSNYIQAVQNNNFVGVGNAITFDGLVLRAQRLW